MEILKGKGENMNNKSELDIKTLPKWEFDNLCRYIVNATREYMKDPENKKRFEEWKKEQEEKQKKEGGET